MRPAWSRGVAGLDTVTVLAGEAWEPRPEGAVAVGQGWKVGTVDWSCLLGKRVVIEDRGLGVERTVLLACEIGVETAPVDLYGQSLGMVLWALREGNRWPAFWSDFLEDHYRELDARYWRRQCLTS